MFVRVSKYQDEHYVYMIASGCCCKALPKNDIKKRSQTRYLHYSRPNICLLDKTCPCAGKGEKKALGYDDKW